MIEVNGVTFCEDEACRDVTCPEHGRKNGDDFTITITLPIHKAIALLDSVVDNTDTDEKRINLYNAVDTLRNAIEDTLWGIEDDFPTEEQAALLYDAYLHNERN
jgi:hypothetical protein